MSTTCIVACFLYFHACFTHENRHRPYTIKKIRYIATFEVTSAWVHSTSARSPLWICRMWLFHRARQPALVTCQPFSAICAAIFFQSGLFPVPRAATKTGSYHIIIYTDTLLERMMETKLTMHPNVIPFHPSRVPGGGNRTSIGGTGLAPRLHGAPARRQSSARFLALGHPHWSLPARYTYPPLQ